MREPWTPPADLDPECLALSSVLNQLPGIATSASCSGHGATPFRIFFVADSLTALAAVAFYVTHGNYGDWRILARTDSTKSGVSFLLEGPVGGYAGANAMAADIHNAEIRRVQFLFDS
jgi:hypothetical protein